MKSLALKLSHIALILFACTILCISMTGCLPSLLLLAGDDENPSEPESPLYENDWDHDHHDLSSGLFEDWEDNFPGTYEVPDGWVVAPSHSTSTKLFYVETGEENARMPDNVAVNVGTNHYAKEDHTAFRQAILRQLSAQAANSDAEINGSGETTPAGDILYVFTVKEDGCTTTFYYVVGDYEFCLFQATDFDESTAAGDAARVMADSFTWSDSADTTPNSHSREFGQRA